MTMREIVTIKFVDADSQEEALAVIRAIAGQIALCLSLQQNGDVEVFFGPEEGERLIEALRQAILVSRGQQV